MRKAALTLFALAAVNYAAAQLTEDASYSYETASGTFTTISLISGSGSTSTDGTSALKESSTAWLLDGATVNFGNSGKTYTLSNTKFGYGNFSMGVKGDSVLNFGAGATDGINAKQGISNSYVSAVSEGIKFGYANLTINVDKDYAGKIELPTIGCQSTGRVILNLNKENALSATQNLRIYVGGNGKVEINASANQNMCWDARGNGYIFNVSNGAALFFKDMNLTGSTHKTTQTIDSLDGDILFVKSIVDSYDADSLSLVLKKRTHPTTFDFSFTNNTGSDLFMGEKTINGVDYIYISNTQIPEPAEWAAIFGVLALAFVAYRRRK